MSSSVKSRPRTAPRLRLSASQGSLSARYTWAESAVDRSRPTSPSQMSVRSLSSMMSKRTFMTDASEHIVSLQPSQLPRVSWNDSKKYIAEVMKLWATYVYDGKLEDLNANPTSDREQRFHEIFLAAGDTAILNLRESNLGGTAGYALAQLLSQDDFFIHLDLTGNLLQDRGALAVASMLTTNTSLVMVDLRSNNIGSHGGVALAEALAMNNTVTHLDLGSFSGSNRNHIGIRGAQAMSYALHHNQVLTHLSLNGNGISVDGAVALSAGLSENSSLLHLDIGSNGIDALGCDSISKSLENSNVETLILSRNNVGDQGASSVEKLIKKYTRLQHIDLSNNHISFAGGLALGDALRNPNMVETLILDRNNLTAAGCKILLASLKEEFISLKTLSLSYNDIDGTIGYELSDCLRRNNSLTRLDLSGNRLENNGCFGLAKALQVNKSLKHLDLSYNKIGDEAGTELCVALRENASLTSINLKFNELQDQAAMELAETLKRNTVLLYIDLNYNDMNYRCMAAVQALLAENNKRYKKGELARFVDEIHSLREDEQHMEQLKREVVQRAEETVQAQIEANDYVDKCHLVEKDMKSRAAAREKALMDIIEIKQQIDNELRDSSSLFSRTKADRELKYRTMVNRLQKEVEHRGKAEKKLKHLAKEFEELTLSHERRVKELQAEIKTEMEAKAAAQTSFNFNKNALNAYVEKGGSSPEKAGMSANDKGVLFPQPDKSSPVAKSLTAPEVGRTVPSRSRSSFSGEAGRDQKGNKLLPSSPAMSSQARDLAPLQESQGDGISRKKDTETIVKTTAPPATLDLPVRSYRNPPKKSPGRIRRESGLQQSSQATPMESKESRLHLVDVAPDTHLAQKPAQKSRKPA